MNFYGGYEGKRVAKKQFKLVREKKGKRLAHSLTIEDYIYQAIEFISGKVKAFIERIKELSEDVDYDEMDQELLGLPSRSELEEAVAKASTRDITLDLGGTKIATIQANSLENIDDIVYYIENGFVVFVQYGILNTEARREFDRVLSIELMQLGTHLTHISASEIICAGREVSIEDSNAPKKEAKIYNLSAAGRR